MKNINSKILILGIFIILISACSTNNSINQQSQFPKQYQEWRVKVHDLMVDKPYILPEYDPEINAIQLVYNSSQHKLSFDLYRSDTYSIQKSLDHAQPHTIHDSFFSYSWDEEEHVLKDSTILNRFGVADEPNRIKLNKNTTILNNIISEYNKDGIKIYQLLEDRADDKLQNQIISYLTKKGFLSTQVFIIKLERETLLEFYFIINHHSVHISFGIHNGGEELDHYLSELNTTILNSH